MVNSKIESKVIRLPSVKFWCLILMVFFFSCQNANRADQEVGAMFFISDDDFSDIQEMVLKKYLAMLLAINLK